jgi:hypothetical protein
MATQIHRELEDTRAELRRGVLELPQETQETTGEMRRVVADQIKALNELSALVSRSNRAVDASPPVAAAAAGAPRRAAEPVAAPAPAPAPSMRRAEPAREAPPARPTTRREPPPAPAPEPRQETHQPNGEQGWLSSLLTRASQEEDGGAEDAAPALASAPAAKTFDSLDSISGDIARMIDHEAAADLWERYSRGERNVFSRRLYTVQGQQTFDEIRRKYRRDEEFRQTVDRYVEEFERLIAEVSRNDRDRTLARTYLTSETGKVYTMLAHASGRFD